MLVQHRGWLPGGGGRVPGHRADAVGRQCGGHALGASAALRRIIIRHDVRQLVRFVTAEPYRRLRVPVTDLNPLHVSPTSKCQGAYAYGHHNFRRG